MLDETCPTTLYVGNLDQTVSEDLLTTLFSQIGEINGCKVIREPGSDPYAFVDFTNHQAATTALTVMNKRIFLGREMKVNWATSPGNEPKVDTSSHHHIFVGDLSPEIDTKTLKEAFAPFGEITNCRIVRDPQTLKSKGYAFLSFVKKAEAENAILAMNGQWLGSRSIRTNWSIRKPPPPRDVKHRKTTFKTPTYEEVFNQASPTNTTVYCGGFLNGISEDLIYEMFTPFGDIIDTRIFKDKGYAFIKFTTKESAARAIEYLNNREINGHVVKCFWGKENDPYGHPFNSMNFNNVDESQGFVYGSMNNFWYPSNCQQIFQGSQAYPFPHISYQGIGFQGPSYNGPWSMSGTYSTENQGNQPMQSMYTYNSQ